MVGHSLLYPLYCSKRLRTTKKNILQINIVLILLHKWKKKTVSTIIMVRMFVAFCGSCQASDQPVPISPMLDKNHSLKIFFDMFVALQNAMRVKAAPSPFQPLISNGSCQASDSGMAYSAVKRPAQSDPCQQNPLKPASREFERTYGPLIGRHFFTDMVSKTKTINATIFQ